MKFKTYEKSRSGRLSHWVKSFIVGVTLVGCGAVGAAEAEDAKEHPPNLRRGTVLLPGFEKPGDVVYEAIDGHAIFEGDIILGKVDKKGNLVKEFSTQGVVNKNALWTDGIIPFVMNSNVDKVQIRRAMQLWEDKTAIRFVDYKPSKHSNYVRFKRGTTNTTCSAAVGMQGGEQSVLVGSNGNCGSGKNGVGVVAHELGHTIGFYHEHNRGDRDRYVTINWDNISSGLEYAFCRAAGGPMQGREKDFCLASPPNRGEDLRGYDFSSIMHYFASTACKSGNIPGRCIGLTIEPKNPNNVINRGTSPSDGDIATVNQMYAIDFRDELKYGDFDCDYQAVCKLGDVNNDGIDDLVLFVRSSKSGSKQGDVYVRQGNGNGFNAPYKAHDLFCVDQQRCDVADVDGKGGDDLVLFVNEYPSPGFKRRQVYVALSNGHSFGTARSWTTGLCMQTRETCLTGDFNGDGRDEVIAFHNGAWGGGSTVYVYPSNGSNFYYPGKAWHTDFCRSGETCAVGDVNGDGRDDIVTFTRGPNASGANGDVYVAFSNGNSFGSKQKRHKNICYGNQVRCLVSDVNGDGRADIVTTTSVGRTINGPGSDVYVAFSYGGGFGASIKRHDFLMLSNSDVVLSGRLNGDKKADLISISPSSNRHKLLYWYLN